MHLPYNVYPFIEYLFFAQNTALGAEFYQQLLAIYLYQIDL